jgi:uncharacterized protein (TIGR02145 family)
MKCRCRNSGLILIILSIFLIQSCKEDKIAKPNLKYCEFNEPQVTDIDGNVYNTVIIGEQVWMAENLKTTKYNDGSEIPNTTESLTNGAFCDYNNTPSNSTTYGRLYNWYVVDNNEGTREASNGGKNVCPKGWHVPRMGEWTTLISFLGGEAIAGGELKETGINHWSETNIGATNAFCFTSLPGGYFSFYKFSAIGTCGYWWSTTEISTSGSTKYPNFNNGSIRIMFSDDSRIYKGSFTKDSYLSVRCIRD